MAKTATPRRVGAGDVRIVLDGDEHVMRPTWGAAQTLSRQSGGLASAIERCLRLDLDAIVQVITLGLGLTQTGAKNMQLAEKIWRTGLTDDAGGLSERCITYVRCLAAGGRLPGENDDDEDDKDDKAEAPQDPVDPRRPPRSTRGSSTA